MPRTARSDHPTGGPSARGRRRIVVRRSGVHGRGVFAARALAAGEWVIDYAGERITEAELGRRGLLRPDEPGYTCYFALQNGDLIDASVNGNSARFINHSCDPSCEAVEEDGRILIRTLRAIEEGEELTYDYRLEMTDDDDPEDLEDFRCRCGSPRCRGTMILVAQADENP